MYNGAVLPNATKTSKKVWAFLIIMVLERGDREE
jgi:hypothetical protein